MVKRVSHYYFRCEEDPKNPTRSLAVLENMCKKLLIGQAIIFAASDNDAEMIIRRLTETRISCFRFPSKEYQQTRDEVVKKFKRGEIKSLVVTDSIAREMKLRRAFLVVNWHVPRFWSQQDGKWGGGDPTVYYRREETIMPFRWTGLCLTFVRSDDDERCLIEIADQLGIELHVLKESEIANLSQVVKRRDEGVSK